MPFVPRGEYKIVVRPHEGLLVVYVDAAKHQYRPHTYVVVVVRATDGKLLNACSVRGRSAEQAEESTIALALNGTPEVSTILSDSRMAIANLGHGSIRGPGSKPAAEKQVDHDTSTNQVLLKVPDQEAYYSRQLYQYHLCVVEHEVDGSMPKKVVHSYTWSKDENSKGSNQVASAVHDTL
ncbi:hypothetical protein MRX96_002316 [Rhipicephalus microplus]